MNSMPGMDENHTQTRMPQAGFDLNPRSKCSLGKEQCSSLGCLNVATAVARSHNGWLVPSLVPLRPFLSCFTFFC